ncbi:hypothetical protein [Allocoleopsis sp.]|uniref:hypothetical protein n=1 Tax=Allocoleopsis sp. TaxID=3088169 RepID=UPI002FD2762B
MSPQNELRGIFLGISLLLGMHFAALFCILAISLIISIITTPIINNYQWELLLIFPFIGIGIFQFIYVIPVSMWLKQREEYALMKGVIIGAVITALLNGGCWLLVSSGSWLR